MHHKVLIIEDTRSFAALLAKLIFDSHKISCDIAETMQQAVNFIKNKPRDYYLAIADLNLPDAPNGEIVDYLVDKNLPTIVFTGSSSDSTRTALWQRGITDYAHKSGKHSLEYVVWLVKRIQLNATVGVLIVDDTLAARKKMAQLLRTQRFSIYLAENAEVALGILDENPNIRLAIIDCFMETMSGIELTTTIRDKRDRGDLEIIGISSNSSNGLSAEFIKSGANDFLSKPFQPEEFLCRVNHAVDRIQNFHKLHELNKTKNELLATAAHDIRGPIGTIKTAADYILNRSPSEERSNRLLNMIQNSSSELLVLLNELLDVSVIESGKPKLNLNKDNLSIILKDRIALYSDESEKKNIIIDSEIPESTDINIDTIKIKQVIDNLLTNAIKYSKIGRSIFIELIESSQEICIKVHDSGPGITQKEQAQLFKPFVVLSTKTTGGEKKTGLGLAIAKRIVEAHNGNITYADSKIGGACFSFYIPYQ